MKYCSQCGKPMQDEAKFCPTCGAKQVSIEEIEALEKGKKPEDKALKEEKSDEEASEIKKADEEISDEKTPDEKLPDEKKPVDDKKKKIIIGVAIGVAVLIVALIFAFSHSHNKAKDKVEKKEPKKTEQKKDEKKEKEKKEKKEEAKPKITNDEVRACYENILENPGVSSFVFVDLNNDGYDELITRAGNCEANYIFHFYAVDLNKMQAACTGSFGAGHTLLFTYNGNLYAEYMHMGSQEIDKFVPDGSGGYSVETIATDYAGPENGKSPEELDAYKVAGIPKNQVYVLHETENI